MIYFLIKFIEYNKLLVLMVKRFKKLQLLLLLLKYAKNYRKAIKRGLVQTFEIIAIGGLKIILPPTRKKSHFFCIYNIPIPGNLVQLLIFNNGF